MVKLKINSMKKLLFIASTIFIFLNFSSLSYAGVLKSVGGDASIVNALREQAGIGSSQKKDYDYDFLDKIQNGDGSEIKTGDGFGDIAFFIIKIIVLLQCFLIVFVILSSMLQTLKELGKFNQNQNYLVFFSFLLDCFSKIILIRGIPFIIVGIIGVNI